MPHVRFGMPLLMATRHQTVEERVTLWSLYRRAVLFFGGLLGFATVGLLWEAHMDPSQWPEVALTLISVPVMTAIFVPLIIWLSKRHGH